MPAPTSPESGHGDLPTREGGLLPVMKTKRCCTDVRCELPADHKGQCSEARTNANLTAVELTAAFDFLKAIVDTIRELGEVPSGHLYARLADKITVAQYGQVIEILKRSGLVRESGAHLLTWIRE